MLSTYPGYTTYASFAYTDAPSGEPASESWMRIGYAQTVAIPLRFDPVKGKNDTYLLFNMWPGHSQYVKTTTSPDTSHWLQAFADPGEGGTPFRFVPAATGGHYMIDASDDAGRCVAQSRPTEGY